MARKKNSDNMSSSNETESTDQESSCTESPSTKDVGEIWLPTGSTLLDLVVGAGRGLGHEAGQVINLVSESQGGKCLTNGLILTKEGLRYLADIIDPYGCGFHEETIQLYGEKGEEVTTSHVYKEIATELIKIETEGGFTIEGTPEHKVEVQVGSKFVMKRLDELAQSDIIPLHVGTNKYGKDNPIFYSFPGEMGNRAKECTIPLYLTEELAEFLGYFVADGTYPSNTSMRINNSQDVIKQRVHYVVKKVFGVDSIVKKDNVLVCSVWITDFIKSLFNRPVKFTARFKYVPQCILSAPERIQKAFIRAYLDCDGGMSKGRIYEFSSASERLFTEVRAMLLNMGIYVGHIKRNGVRAGSVFYPHTYHRGTIGGHWFKKYIEDIGTINSVDEFMALSDREWVIPEDISILPLSIRSIDIIKNTAVPVYDVTVPDTHLFMTVGFVNHNTALCNEAIANAHHRFKDKFKWIYDGTCEGGNTFDTQKLYGIEIIPKKAATKSRTIQEAYGNIMNFLKDLEDDEFGIYVLDSIDAVTSDEIEDISDGRLESFDKGKKYDKGSYQGQKPKFLSSEFLPRVTSLAEKKNCLVIIVSQLRDNVNAGLYAPKDRISNGRALLFYCSSRIWLKTKAEIERAGKPIGVVVHAETRKARGPKPYRSCMYVFYYEYGIDDVGGNIDFLYNLRTPERGELSKTAAKNINWDGTTYTREDLIGFIEANDLEEELRNRTIAEWNRQEEEASKETSERKKRF